MGYSHYWKIKQNKKVNYYNFRVLWNKALAEINAMLPLLPKYSTSAGNEGTPDEGEIKLAFEYDLPKNTKLKPVFNESEIRFNGVGEYGCETFLISTHSIGNMLWDGLENGRNGGSIKTNRRPYDFVVCICLIALWNNLPKSWFTVLSDGDMEDWKPCLEFYTETTGKPIQPHIIKYFESKEQPVTAS